MSPAEAAVVIGMSAAQVRQACRKGLIRAVKRPFYNGHVYDISKAEARRYRDHRPRRGPKKGIDK